MTNAHAKTNIQ